MLLRHLTRARSEGFFMSWTVISVATSTSSRRSPAAMVEAGSLSEAPSLQTAMLVCIDYPHISHKRQHDVLEGSRSIRE